MESNKKRGDEHTILPPLLSNGQSNSFVS